jgi:hypothetical protein
MIDYRILLMLLIWKYCVASYLASIYALDDMFTFL